MAHECIPSCNLRNFTTERRSFKVVLSVIQCSFSLHVHVMWVEIQKTEIKRRCKNSSETCQTGVARETMGWSVARSSRIWTAKDTKICTEFYGRWSLECSSTNRYLSWCRIKQKKRYQIENDSFTSCCSVKWNQIKFFFVGTQIHTLGCDW